MTQATYDIHTDVRYAPLEKIEAGALVDQCTERWWNQTLVLMVEPASVVPTGDS